MANSGTRRVRMIGIAANTVNVLQPSELRGVELTASPPPPPPPPDPGNVRYGVVTAQVLNVRGQPGVRCR